MLSRMYAAGFLICVVGCSSNDIVEEIPETTCEDGQCNGGETPLSCPSDCPAHIVVPKEKSSHVKDVALFDSGRLLEWSVESQKACNPLQEESSSIGGWQVGYFSPRQWSTDLLPFWGHASNCPVTTNPYLYQGKMARIRFEVPVDGHYQLKMWTPKFDELCAFEYKDRDILDITPMMKYIQGVLVINSDTNERKQIDVKMTAGRNNTKNGVARVVIEKQYLRQGEHELFMYDYSPNATSCPALSENPTKPERFFADTLHIYYLPDNNQ